MRVPLLNFEGGPGVLLLNFEGGPGVPLLNFRVVPGPTFKLWRGSQVPGPRVPQFRFLWFWSHFYTMLISFRRVLFNHCTVNKFKMVLISWQKISLLAVSLDILSKNVFRWIFGDRHEKCSKAQKYPFADVLQNRFF